jgi:hypothetical protein
MNKVDMGINVFGSLLSGGLFGFSIGTSSLLVVGKEFVMGYIGAIIVMQPLTKVEQLGIRGVTGTVTDNPYYDNMIDNKSISFIPEIPDGDGDGIFEVCSDLNEIKKIAITEGATNTQIAEINAAIRTAEANGGSVAMANNPNAKIVFEKARNGDYGNGVQEYFTNSQGDGRGMNRQSNYEKASQSKNQELSQTIKDGKIAKAKNTLNIITLILPFVSTALDEAGLIALANAAQEDCSNSISVTAENY